MFLRAGPRQQFLLPFPPFTAELDRLTGSRPQDDRPAPPKRSLGVMSREAKADSILSGRLKVPCVFLPKAPAKPVGVGPVTHPEKAHGKRRPKPSSSAPEGEGD